MTFNDDDVVRELEAAREHETEPPPGFVATIMRGVAAAHARLPLWRRWARARRAANLSRTHGVVPGVRMQSEGRRPTAAFAREGIVAKKALWALAGFGGIAIIVALFVGVPSLHSGTEATIGAAKRYNAPSSGSASVPLGDMTAQQFLQSDTFDRLMKDPNTRAVLQMAAKDAAFRAEIASPELQQMLAGSAALREGLADPAFVNVLLSADFQRAAGDAAFERAMADPAFMALVSNPALRADLVQPNFLSALARISMSKAIAAADLQDALAKLDIQHAMLTPAWQKAMREDAQFNAAMREPELVKALSERALVEALTTESFRNLIGQQRLQQDLVVPAIQAAMLNQAFEKAIAEPAFVSMWTKQAFTAGLAQLQLVQKAMGQANLAAAFMNLNLAPAIAAPAMHAVLMSAEFQKQFVSR